MDLDAAWDSAIQFEENVVKMGLQDGKESRKDKDWNEGHRMGRVKGAQVGREVGFYLGFARATLEREGKHDGSKKKSQERLEKALKSLVEMAEAFPEENCKDGSAQERLEEMRAKFKMCCTYMGVKTENVLGGDVAKGGISW